MKKLKTGFTLIELLVSVSIIVLILSVVLWNYGSFNDELALSAAAQELALNIREAQTYGINVKESAVNSNQFNFGYGIHIISGFSNYTVFIDSNIVNNQFDPITSCGSSPTECIRRVDFRNGIVVSNVCDATNCPPAAPVGIQRINIVFVRPNPDALIYFANGSLTNIAGPVNSARIQLTSPKGRIKYVNIESTGQVSIQ